MGYTPHILVIGGGVVGTGIARDLAIRGLDITLVERGPLAAGATSQTQGILHSGARFADTPTRAKRISREHRTLQTIADHCINDTGGLLFTVSPERDVDEASETLEETSLQYERLDGDMARDVEPTLSDAVDQALKVPDAVVDQVELTLDTAQSAAEYGASIRTHTTVTDITTDGGTIDTVTIEYEPAPEPTTSSGGPTKARRTDGGQPGGNHQHPRHPGGPARTPGETGQGRADDSEAVRDGPKTEKLDPEYVVNAAGAWVGEVAGFADIDLAVPLTAETMCRLRDSPAGTILTRLSGAGDATLVPDGGSAILGPAPFDIEGPDESPVSIEDINAVADSLRPAVPAIEDTDIVRTYGCVRTQPQGTDSPAEWSLLDHGDRDDCWGMTTVVGGTVTTHRLIAEHVADDVCSKFGITRECKTDELPLPGNEPDGEATTAQDTAGRPVLCDCQSVTRGEIQAVFDEDLARPVDLTDVRIRTGATRGSCQGRRCAHAVASELYPDYDESVVTESFEELCRRIWGDQRHALVGSQLTETMQTYQFHVETMNRGGSNLEFVESKSKAVEESMDDEEASVSATAVGLAAFDDGRDDTRRDRPPWGERQL